MYRSVGPSDGRKERRRSFGVDGTRVNSQVFDLRGVKSGPGSEFQGSRSEANLPEKEKEKDSKDKRKIHMSKTSNRSSLYVFLQVSTNNSHTLQKLRVDSVLQERTQQNGTT
jgi:hypothetical protein